MIQRPQFLGEYQLGESGRTRMRTIGEAEIVTFAGITCDFSYVHLAHHATVTGPYGGRIAHGLLGTSLVAGLLSLDAPHVVGRNVPGAALGGFDANYRDAIRLGETVRIEWRIAEIRDTAECPALGSVRSAFRLVAQDERVVYDGCFDLLVPRESGSGVEPPTFAPRNPWALVEFEADPKRVYNLEDFPIGAGGTTESRTMTETDVVNFVALTGDYSPLYVDEEFARRSPYRGRIVPGVLVFTSAFGMWARDGEVGRARSSDSSKDAGHLNDSAVFLAPVRVGDSIRCRYRIAATRVSRGKRDRGIIRYEFQVLNQRDEVVQEGKTLMMRATSGG